MKKSRSIRIIAFLLACVLPLTALAAERHSLAWRYDYDTLDVGGITPMEGNFFGPVFGDNGSDRDIQLLLHDYSPVEWDALQGCYVVNPAVTSKLLIQDTPDGGRDYIVFLDQYLHFSDDSKITASDYLFSLLLCTSPMLTELGGKPLDRSAIQGLVAYQTGYEDEVSGVRLLNEYAFSIHVTADALPNFYELQAVDITPYPMALIAPECEIRDGGEGIFIFDPAGNFKKDSLEKALLDPDTGYVTHPTVVSGPYILVDYDGTKASFEINAAYKGSREGYKPAISYLTYQTVPENRAVELLNLGRIGLLVKAARRDVIEEGVSLVKKRTFLMTKYARSGGAFIACCCERLCTSDVNVRQAIAYAFDKDGAVKSYVGASGLRVDGWYGLGQWTYRIVSGDVAAMRALGTNAADWQDVTLDGAELYEQDPERAAWLLDAGGWKLNKNGDPYTDKDGQRYKAFSASQLEARGLLTQARKDGAIETDADTVLVPLSLKLYYPEGSEMGRVFKRTLVEPLKGLGVTLKLQEMPYSELAACYTRETERDCDLIFLGVNFGAAEDPGALFADPATAPTAINDAQLNAAAADLHRTQAGDLLTYCEKWVDMQRCFQDVVPAIFVYSDLYVDFCTYALNHYEPENYTSWAKAIVSAYMGDPSERSEVENINLSVP